MDELSPADYNALAAGAKSFIQYRRSQIAELRPYVPGESMKGISISESDGGAGSPNPGP